MAGHSKWANIKHRKAAQDNRRGKIFTKLIRELTAATKTGGADAESNPRLRAAIDKALSSNMKRDTIAKAIARGSGDQDGVDYEEVRYEGYATHGVAILVDCLTDNRQRTVADVRHLFNRHGGNLGTSGSVLYLFEQKGVFVFAQDRDDADHILDICIEAGADDFTVGNDIRVFASPDAYPQIRSALEQSNLSFDYAEMLWQAKTKRQLSPENSDAITRLIGALEDLDDVQTTYSTLSVNDQPC